MAMKSGRRDDAGPPQPLTGGLAGGPGPTPPGFTDGTEPPPPAPREGVATGAGDRRESVRRVTNRERGARAPRRGRARTG